jgi:uncharacterized protein
MKNLQSFATRYQQHFLKGDVCTVDRSTNDILCIHGAGKADRTRYAALRSSLQQEGLGSVAFDCIGHGETGGLLEQSSLVSRTHQAEAVIQACEMNKPLTLIGASMGAYCAIDLTQTNRVNSLVLIVPGVYAPDAYQVPFGPAFSSVIRQHRSWETTDAWEQIARFPGSLLVIAAELDDVIPFEIPQRLISSASASCWKKLHVVKGAGHSLLLSLSKNQPATDDVMEDVVSCIRAGASSRI